MRRFSWMSKHLQRPKHAELAFLEQMPVPPSQNSSVSFSKFDDGSVLPFQQPSQRKKEELQQQLSTTPAMKLLHNAVKRRNYKDAEEVFARAPKLSQRPAAMRLLIKMYCDQLDFTTAKALLFSTLDKVGEDGAARFIVHTTYISQNAADIEEVVNRVIKQFTSISPLLASTALYGLRVLGDIPAFDRVWNLVQQFWEPSLKPATLQAKALDALLNEDWKLAGKLWRIAQGLSKSEVRVRKLQIWYMACRYFLVENPQIESVDAVLRLMKEHDLKMDSSFSTLLVRYLAPFFPGMSAVQWIEYATKQGWPLDGTMAKNAIIFSRGGLISRFGPEVGSELQKYAAMQLVKSGFTVDKHKLGEGDRFRTDLGDIQKAPSSTRVLEVLKNIQKRGLRVPFDHFVLAFTKMTQLFSSNNSPTAAMNESELREVVAMMKAYGYPLHCAGTDLSIVELHCRAVHYEKQVCQRLLGEYLVQYPVISHDLPQLTRMAVLMNNCGSYNEAATIVDSMRAEQQHNADFSCANHDSASLQVLAMAKFRLKEPLTPFLRGVINDEPSIYFDKTFIRKISRMLALGNEGHDLVADLENASRQAVANAYAEIDVVVKRLTELIG